MSQWGKLTYVLLLIGCSRGLPPGVNSTNASGASAGTGGRASTRPASPAASSGSNAGASGAKAGSAGSSAAKGGADAAATSGGTAGAAADKNTGIKASDEVFRDDMLRTYELTFSDADWNMLQQTATQETYVPVMLSVDGTAVGKVGVRYKGSTGTLQGCFSNGMQTCAKLSMKLKLDEYDQNLRFHGLKKLNLHSSMLDHSHLHERLSYKLFRDFGVLAPRSAHARVKINGEYKGLYNLTEEVDGRFADYRFMGQEGQGTLYKEAWPAASQDPGYYTNAQHTNEGMPVTKVVSFATDLASAPSAGLGSVVSRWMDPDAVLRYLAVHTVVKHWDGPLTFYCTKEYGCNNHNYYLYESPTKDQFAIVAWDVDNTFLDNSLPDQANVPSWYEPTTDCDVAAHTAKEDFLPPGCDKLVQGFVQLGVDKWRAMVGKLLEGPYQVAAMQADVDRWAAQIDESVKTDPAGTGYEDWRGSVDQLKTMIDARHTRAAAYRDGN